MRHNMEEREGTAGRSAPGPPPGTAGGGRPKGDPPSPERGLRLSAAPVPPRGGRGRREGGEQRRGEGAPAPAKRGRLCPRASRWRAAPRSRGEGARRPPAPQLQRQPGIGAAACGPAATSLRRAGEEGEPGGCSPGDAAGRPTPFLPVLARPPAGAAPRPGRRWRGGSPERRQPAGRLPASLFLPPPLSPAGAAALPCGPTGRLAPLGPLPAPPRVGGPGALTGGRTPRAPPQSRLLPLPLLEPSPQAAAPAPGRPALLSRETAAPPLPPGPRPRLAAPGPGRRRRPLTRYLPCPPAPPARPPERPLSPTAGAAPSTASPGGRGQRAGREAERGQHTALAANPTRSHNPDSRFPTQRRQSLPVSGAGPAPGGPALQQPAGNGCRGGTNPHFNAAVPCRGRGGGGARKQARRTRCELTSCPRRPSPLPFPSLPFPSLPHRTALPAPFPGAPPLARLLPGPGPARPAPPRLRSASPLVPPAGKNGIGIGKNGIGIGKNGIGIGKNRIERNRTE
ncbi:uncharacterized protein LOC142417253 [Mycteria americana]|uniref:uncharacterized protein LOC142417253 n=1 Tax=Mycteria americana TaxID=33587 RepID=UPI003F58A009